MATKLKIEAYKNVDFTKKVGDYTVRFNPEKLKHNINIQYDEKQGIGTSGTAARYNKTKPETISIKILFDKTLKKANEKILDVDVQIEKFQKLVLDYNGQSHRPNYLKLSWGTFLFKGQLKSLDIDYELYNAAGKPLRAVANLTLMEVLNNKTRSAMEGRQSSDLTHVYTIKEGDSLPRLAHEIYGDPIYYIELAKVNNLDNFRTLIPGNKLVIPPLEN